MELTALQFGSYRIIFLLAIAGAILAEVVWNWRTGRRVYSARETLANLAVLIGYQFFGKVVTAGAKLYLLDVAHRWAPVHLAPSVGTFLLCFVLVDLAYYFFHWVSHKNGFMWAFHHTHHSSPHYNLSGAYRLNWFGGLVNLLFFLPLVLVGFSPTQVVGCLALNLFYQFFLHTQAVGKLGWLERVLNTPSAHRVHHGCNDEYLDKNFGGVLIV